MFKEVQKIYFVGCLPVLLFFFCEQILFQVLSHKRNSNIHTLQYTQLHKNENYSLNSKFSSTPKRVLSWNSFVLLIDVGLNYLLCLILFVEKYS